MKLHLQRAESPLRVKKLIVLSGLGPVRSDEISDMFSILLS
jgi:hypothetical protein